MHAPDLVPPDRGDAAWQRRVVVLGAVVVVVVVIGVVLDLPHLSATPPRVAAVTLACLGCTSWLAQMLMPSKWPWGEAGLLVGAGLCGAALNGILPSSPGYVLAYGAVASIGLRFRLPTGSGLALMILIGTDLGILTESAHAGSSMLGTDAGLVFVFLVGASLRSARLARQRTEQLLVALEESQRARARDAALAERARLAREMHDVLSHTLYGLVLSMNTLHLLVDKVGADPRLAAEVDRAHGLVHSGAAEARRAIGALHGAAVPGPELLPELVAAAEGMGVEARLSVHGSPRPITPRAALTVYRTAQESLTNTAKYAGPGATSELRLDWEAPGVRLVVVDRPTLSGVGPPADGLWHAGGHGLTGLAERAALAGGRLLTARTADGFMVDLRLPYLGPVVDTPGALSQGTAEWGTA